MKVTNPYRLSYDNYRSYLVLVHNHIMINSSYSRYIIVIIFILVILLYSHVYLYPNTIVIDNKHIYQSDISYRNYNCTNNNDHSYVIYNIKVKLQVNYEANHWFHMAENIMTYHSILRSKGRLGNASRIIYNFDTRESRH